MANRNHFHTLHVSKQGGRTGRLEVVSPWTAHPSQLETPAAVPVVNIVGGPPGPERNGGIWRPIKWWMFLHEQVPAFQCSILHPLDMSQAKPTWSGWRAKPFGKWIVDWQQQVAYPVLDPRRPDGGYPYRAFMTWWEYWRRSPGFGPRQPIHFSESAGHALAGERMAKKYRQTFGQEVSQRAICELQLEMGADVIMSLDYPLERGLLGEEVHRRQSQSIANGLALMELLAERGATAMPYVAVHGVDREDVRAYVERFIAGWKGLSAAARAIPFGFAVGSIDSVASQPDIVIDIMLGVRDGLRHVETSLGYRPPVHVLGITSRLMGVLAYLGADTFSSRAYAGVAGRGRYLTDTLKPINISEVTEQTLAQCDCFICATIRDRRFLPEWQAGLAKKKQAGDIHADQPGGIGSWYRHTAAGDAYTYSDLAGLLAMHNWVQISREVGRVRSAIQDDALPEYLKDVALQRGDSRRLLRALERLAAVEEGDGSSSPLQVALGNHPEVALAGPRLALPENYQPPSNKDVLLLLEADARILEVGSLLSTLKSLLPPPTSERIHVVTVSVAQGLVPNELTPGSVAAPGGELAELQELVVNYLSRFRRHYQHVIACGEGQAWQAAVGKALEDAGLGQLLSVPGRGKGPLKRLLHTLRKLPGRSEHVQLRLWDMM